MRLTWLLVLLAALFPERLAWRGEGDCCADECACTAGTTPSCCDAPEGPVIVALCGCGEPHEPRLIERARCDWFAGQSSPAGLALPRAGWPDEPRTGIPGGRTLAPEPPPPRPLV